MRGDETAQRGHAAGWALAAIAADAEKVPHTSHWYS